MSKYVCQRCGVGVGLWAKGSGTIWKHQANMHNPSCRKPPIVVERAAYEREMASFVEDALRAVEQSRGRTEEKRKCPKCDGFGYLDGDDDPECDICEGNGMATISAIRYFEKKVVDTGRKGSV